MKSFSIRTKHITKVLRSGTFLGLSLACASIYGAAGDTLTNKAVTTNNLTVNNSMGIGGFTPQTTQGIFSNHQNYGAGNSNVYGYRAGGSGKGGTSWDVNGVESVFKGYNYSGDPYSAAVVALGSLNGSPTAALVAAGDRNGTSYATYLSYRDPLSANLVYSAYFNSNILIGPAIAGQRWILYSDNHVLTIAPDSSTNFAWGKNFTINKNNGQVGIGVTPADNSTNKLEVAGNAAIKGTLTTNAITVTATISPWPDFVFNRSYKPRPLSETESYIKKNGHLPGMPTQKDIAKNGINVGEMQAKMLKTIEEMTLQMIALKKENEALAATNKQLAARMDKIDKN
jgi:hypothetical protein